MGIMTAAANAIANHKFPMANRAPLIDPVVAKKSDLKGLKREASPRFRGPEFGLICSRSMIGVGEELSRRFPDMVIHVIDPDSPTSVTEPKRQVFRLNNETALKRLAGRSYDFVVIDELSQESMMCSSDWFLRVVDGGILIICGTVVRETIKQGVHR